MESLKEKILVSGASIAGLCTAFWMNKSGYKVTVVETASEPRTMGGAVDFKDKAIDFAKKMGIFEQLKANRLNVEKVEFKNDLDITEGALILENNLEELPEDEIEIERDKFISILINELKNDVEFIFNDSVTTLTETKDSITVTFKSGLQQTFSLVIGCDGIHSGIRKLCFGEENQYSHFLNAYFSITILDKLLVAPKTMQMYNVPDKSIMLNAYNNKTDIIFCFYSEDEIQYDYRNLESQKEIMLKQFAGESWRTRELLEIIKISKNFYFDKFCQIKMPFWTKGRVALVGDAGYCASPAAGMGASLSMIGAGTLAELLLKHKGNYENAFNEYNTALRPFIDKVQAKAANNIKDNFIPRTEEAIRLRNTQTVSF